MSKKLAIGLGLALLLLATQAIAQNPTGTLTGRVADDTGGVLPGVMVSAESSTLQGTRTTTTGVNGDYKIAFLPPGEYTVTYSLDGFQTSVREVKLSAAQTTPSNITMALGAVTEQIVVTSQQALISETQAVAQTTTYSEVESLPIERNIGEIVNLAPGVANSGFRESTPVMAGAPSFENLYMVNGVVINENIRSSDPRSVHRRRHPGNHHFGLRRFGGVRSLHRRRDQRHHQVRRQRVRRFAANQLRERGLGSRRPRSRPTLSRTTSDEILRGHPRRLLRDQGSPVVLRRRS